MNFTHGSLFPSNGVWWTTAAVAAPFCTPSPRRLGALPRFLLGLDLPDDIFHPEHEVPDHAEEAELVSRVYQSHPAALTSIQQGLPGFQDLILTFLDVISLVPCVGCLEAGCVLLQLLHLGSCRGEKPGSVLWPCPSPTPFPYPLFHIHRNGENVSLLGLCPFISSCFTEYSQAMKVQTYRAVLLSTVQIINQMKCCRNTDS